MPETVHTQVHPRVMTGLQADRPVHPSENGLVYVSQTDISIWDAYANAGAGAWRAAADTPAAAGWPDYVVSKGDPVAPFSTIQSAINAATLTDVEQLVLVHPGTYVEDITMAARVRVIGLPTVAAGVASQLSSDVIIQGNVKIDNATDGFTFLLANVQVQPPSGTTCVLLQTAALAQKYCFQNCALIADGAAAVYCQANGTASTLEMRNCLVQTTNAGGGAIFCALGISAILQEVSLFAEAVGSPAVVAIGGTSGGGGVTWTLQRCSIFGAVTMTNVNAFITDSDLTVAGAAGITVDAATTLKIVGLDYSIGLTDNLIAGSGVATKLQGLNSINTTAANNARVNIASTVVQDEPPFNARGNVKTTLNGAGPFTIVPADEVYITPSAAAIAVLPQAAKFIHGARTTIITNGAFNVEIQTFAGDKIDNLTNGTFTLPATTGTLLPAVELQCDANLPGWFVVSRVVAVPSSPTLYVASTGSNTNSGTAASPLLTLSEALSRMGVSGWSGQATVVIVDNLGSQGSEPQWNVPAPRGGALPLLIQGTYTQTLGSTVPTGGTASVIASPPVLATVTSAAAGGANVYRGMFMRFTSGGLSGKRFVVDSNAGGGAFVLTDFVSPAPANTMTFVVEDLASKLTWTGIARISAPGGVWIDGVEFTPGASSGSLSIQTGICVMTACRILSTAAVNSNLGVLAGAEWWLGAAGVQSDPNRPLNLPSGVIAAGCRIDGTAAAGTGALLFGGGALSVGNLTMVGCSVSNTELYFASSNGGQPSGIDITTFVSFNTCGFFFANNNCSVSISYSLFASCRSTPTFVANGYVMSFVSGAQGMLLDVAITASTAANGEILVDDRSGLRVNGLSGANAGAGVPVVATRFSSVVLLALPTITGTGGAGVAEAKVGANAASTWALVNGGLAVNSTDLAAASPQICRIGP